MEGCERRTKGGTGETEEELAQAESMRYEVETDEAFSNVKR